MALETSQLLAKQGVTGYGLAHFEEVTALFLKMV
jgi:hypothetical protein